MLVVLGLPAEPVWLTSARATRADVLDRSPSSRRTAFVPVWRRPWMVLGRDTFAGDMLTRLGVANAFGDSAERYPKVTVAQMLRSAADLVVLPDEPYRFSATDGP
jgi:ABC-type Fe3+-hydroxamate transport system substrate-binding protein